MDLNYSRICGRKILRGTVSISGSKNASLPLFAASLLTEETCILHNVPQLTDVFHMIELLRFLGADICQLDHHTWSITAKQITTCAHKELVKRLRASVYLLGALLGREHRASVPIPGGCKLGERPIDLHLRAFEALGATATQDSDCIVHLQAKKLNGGTFSMKGVRGPTVTGTANAILAAVLALGQSIILNAAEEPEIVSLCLFLKKMGAQIEGIGTDQLTIHGVSSLHGTDFTVQPDRMEAGTFFILGLLCCDTLKITDAPKEMFCGFSEVVSNLDNCCHWEGKDLVVHRLENLSPFNVYAKPYPGFSTDLQPQISILASQIQGVSHVCDTIFPDRFAHMEACRKIGINIEKLENGRVTITGKTYLKGTEIAATDLRAGAAMYLAGLIAEGETVVSRIDYIDRGYENFEAKLRALGASIERIPPFSYPQRGSIYQMDLCQKQVEEEQTDIANFATSKYISEQKKINQ